FFEEDLFPEARNLELPRRTLAQTSGYIRRNYLAPEYALGSMACDNHLISTEMPIFLGYPGPDDRCTIAASGEPRPYAYWSEQREGEVLAAATWLAPTADEALSLNPFGMLSGLKTGLPHSFNLSDAEPAWAFELGAVDRVELVDDHGRPV